MAANSDSNKCLVLKEGEKDWILSTVTLATSLMYVLMLVPICYNVNEYLVKQRRGSNNVVLVLFYFFSTLLCVTRALEFLLFFINQL